MPRKTYGRYGGTASQAGLRVHAPVCFAGGAHAWPRSGTPSGVGRGEVQASARQPTHLPVRAEDGYLAWAWAGGEG